MVRFFRCESLNAGLWTRNNGLEERGFWYEKALFDDFK